MPDRFKKGTDDKVSGPIAKALKNNVPAMIGICSNVFDSLIYRGLNSLSPPNNRNDPKVNLKSDCISHSTLIVGQSKINGQCHYLVRNSAGAYWRPKGATACACMTHAGDYKASCTPEESAENVGCWFPTSDLIPNIGTVDAILK